MLSEAGHSVSVFFPDDSVADRDVDDAKGIVLIRFNSNRNKLHGSLGYTARLSYAFADTIRLRIEEKGSPDLIEAQDYLGIAYYLTQFKHAGYSFAKGIPIVITLHSPAFIYLEYNRTPTFRFPDFWTGEMEKQAIRAADLLISPTCFLVEEIAKFMDMGGLPVHVIPNPYGREDQATPFPDPGFVRNKIVYYGKLSPQKGSFELLAYFRQLWDEGFPHPLHIIGGTDIYYHPENLTMGQWVEKVYKKQIDAGLLQLQGKIRPDEIARSLRDAHVIIFPSIVDNLPYVVMEAMSLGKTVLASRQGGQREMIEDGVSGFLFDHNDPESFSRQLLAILAMSDPALEQIGLNAQDAIRRCYDPPRILAAKMDLLEPLLRPGVQKIRAMGSTGQHIFPFLYQEKFVPIPDQAGQLLSLVIPFYNMGAYIEECVQSVLASTYPSIEILVIDDGSTEKDSLEKLRQLSAWKEPATNAKNNISRSITVLRQKNMGLAATRNKGAVSAKGDFLAFLDADDKVDPVYYEKAIGALLYSDNVFFAGSWVRYFDDSHDLWVSFTPQPPYALVHNPVNSSGLVYKRAAFLAAGLNDKKADYGLEDYASLVSMLAQGFNGVILPEALFYYRVRRGSMFRQVNREKFMYSYKYILDLQPSYYTKYAVQIINLLNANGPGYQFENPTFGVQVSTVVEKEGRWVRQIKSIIKKNERLKRIAIILNNRLKS
jgi:glycosyltransferase involved in cell wall biosynthesis